MLKLIATDKAIEDIGDGEAQKTLIFQAHSGDRIVIQDLDEKHTQINIETKKVDYDLYIFENSTNIPSIIIKDYFAIDEISIYTHNTNGTLVNITYTQINNVDGLLNLVVSERVAINNGQLALGGLAIGVVGTIGGGDGGSNVDTTAPNAPTVSLSDDDNNGKPTASGLAEANSTVTIIWADGSKSITKADSNGKYSIEASTVQLNGDVTAVATDASGNTSSLSTATYNDKQAPQAPTLLVEDTDGDGKPTASGTAEPKSTVIITWPNGTTSTTKADDDGNYSIESPNTQPSGNVSVMGTDTNSNMGISLIPVSYKDKQSPTASITIDDTQLTINETSIVTITFSEAVKDFSKEDVAVENGILSDFTTTDNIVWTAIFTPTINVEDSTNSINLINNYFDIANNTGTIATSDNYDIDTLSNTFIWNAGDVGTDTLDNFDIEGTVDVLNVDDLLKGEDGDATNIGTLLNYIHIEAGTDSTIHISSSGGFTSGDYLAEDTTIVLNNVNLSSFGADDEAIIKSMISGGILVA